MQLRESWPSIFGDIPVIRPGMADQLPANIALFDESLDLATACERALQLITEDPVNTVCIPTDLLSLDEMDRIDNAVSAGMESEFETVDANGDLYIPIREQKTQVDMYYKGEHEDSPSGFNHELQIFGRVHRTLIDALHQTNPDFIGDSWVSIDKAVAQKEKKYHLDSGHALCSVRLVFNALWPGTISYANKDVSVRAPTVEEPFFRQNGNEPNDGAMPFMIPPGSLGVIAGNPWPHMPSAHHMGYTANAGKPENRCRFVNTIRPFPFQKFAR